MRVIRETSLDKQFIELCKYILATGVMTKGRTSTARKRVTSGVTLVYPCRNSNMRVFTLRKNSLKPAIAESIAWLVGCNSIEELSLIHPPLGKIWEPWAANDGSLGGVYSDSFSKNYFPNVVLKLLREPTTTHARITTLIPDKFPISGLSYDENVKAGKFALMPCLHSYHFLSDGVYLNLHATQASGDTAIGVVPHNAYQVQFMLLLTAYLTKLKPGIAYHHIHDVHIYENQFKAVDQLLRRTSSSQQELPIDITLETVYEISSKSKIPLEQYIKLPSLENSNPVLNIPVDF